MSKDRPLSWSQIASFRYSKEQWYKRYVLDEKQIETPELKFGKLIGERIEKDPTYLPQIPRHNKMEHPFSVMFDGIKMVGYADSFCTETNKKLLEFKTGVKEWNQKRVDSHQQIDMYCLMNYITNKVRPEDMEIQLIWLPTKKKESGDFSVEIDFVDEQNIKVFNTKRTMRDILKFGQEIKQTLKEMEEYLESKS